jgi:hypothetical protein
MAHNPNFQRRQYETFGPNFRIDVGNPSMGYNGADVYNLYAFNDEGDVSLVGMTEGGILHIYNDRTIEIIAGQKSEETGVDICITGKNGDIWITAENNGQVRIRGANVVVDADENLTLKSGNNISIEAKNKLELKGSIANMEAKEGNLAPPKDAFMGKCFAETYVEDAAIAKVGKSLTGGLL